MTTLISHQALAVIANVKHAEITVVDGLAVCRVGDDEYAAEVGPEAQWVGDAAVVEACLLLAAADAKATLARVREGKAL